ncbi:MAG: bifunctional glutamate N-acetyltransferase/amino-acid acetyltransferase ArgJ [Pseudomonadales bacterium]|jgi:glutamate N-acetyltransferase/amino-acid N-acetyltransferase|nr:bifunctional glutamate N-acetyltransferase/amino-acid acetyltransferase ArgJ [Pseudomonadales bacterium]
MAVNLSAPEQLLAVPGVRLGTACAGIKQTQRDDVAVFELAEGSETGGVFTQSHFSAAPVLLARQRQKKVRAWVVNSGNANAATGEPGVHDAEEVCSHAGRLLQISADEIQPFSTGVIGERLPVGKLKTALDTASAQLSEQGWLAAAHAIMTTDTCAKGLSRQIDIDGHQVTVTGIAKGSGMIKPNMATMLAYLACDAGVAPGLAQKLVNTAVGKSFNRVTVDGDTSTNDSFVLACTGKSSLPIISSESDSAYQLLSAAINEVATYLAQALVRDGEGATKFVTVCVKGGRTSSDCLSVAYTVAESPLVKTAMFAGDANWGRFCMAIGRSPVEGLLPERVQLWLDDVRVAQDGLMAQSYSESLGAAVLAQDEFTVTIELGLGTAEETVWTTDLSYEYVRINAEYRT